MAPHQGKQLFNPCLESATIAPSAARHPVPGL